MPNDGEFTDDELIDAAWWSYKIGLGGLGEINHLRRPPRWFVLEELGYAIGDISIRQTFVMLAVKNRLALMKLDAEDRPLRVSWPRDFYAAEPDEPTSGRGHRAPADDDAPTFADVLEEARRRISAAVEAPSASADR